MIAGLMVLIQIFFLNQNQIIQKMKDGLKIQKLLSMTRAKTGSLKFNITGLRIPPKVKLGTENSAASYQINVRSTKNST